MTKKFVRLAFQRSRSIQPQVHTRTGTIDVLDTDKEIKMAQSGFPSPFPLAGGELPWPSRAVPKLIQLPQLTSVLISTTESGFGVYGWLKSISRGGITALTSFSVPIRCPLQITVAGCLPVSGEAAYSMKRSRVHQTGVSFPSQRNPDLKVGVPATIHTLDAPFAGGTASVLDVGNNKISILIKAAIHAGSWARIETNSWILFGVVKNSVPMGMMSRLLDIHLEAAFHASRADGSEVAAEPVDGTVAE